MDSPHIFQFRKRRPLTCTVCKRDISWSGHIYAMPGVPAPEDINRPALALFEPQSIDDAARNMEQHSPLFRFTEANPNGSLFG